MVHGNQGSERTEFGGIISLAKFTEEHSEAITFDLLTRTNYQLDDVGGRLTWSSLYSFIRNLDSDSALARDLGKSTGWENTLTTNKILADIYDMLQVLNANLMAIGGKHMKPKPYPRPNDKDSNKERRIGSGAMPFDELQKWFKEKQDGKRKRL